MKLYALRRFLAFLSLPYFRLELPGWQRLSSRAGLPIGNEPLWAGCTPRLVRGKTHGLWMKLHMHDWCERLTYFLGRYYEQGVELALRALLSPGETFIDVGGNIGMTMLMGSAAVGPLGRVHCFEPNKEMVIRIREMIDLNRLENVTVHATGLSDRDEALQLTMVLETSGWATFGRVAAKDPTLTYRTAEATVMRADTLLGDEPCVGTIKVDVEGFECRVLRGMEGLIKRLRPAIVTEVDMRLLEAADASVDELVSIMRHHGYTGYEIRVVGGGIGAKLRLGAMGRLDGPAKNLLWVHPDSNQYGRIQVYIDH